MIVKYGVQLSMMVALVIGLVACPGPKSPPSAGSEPDLTCFWSWEFQDYVDERGRSCRPDTEREIFSSQYCFNFMYDVNEDRWFDDFNRPVRCRMGYIDMNRFKPFTIRINGRREDSCRHWGSNYQPVLMQQAYICVRTDLVSTPPSGGGSFQFCSRQTGCVSNCCASICIGGQFNIFNFFGNLGYCVGL